MSYTILMIASTSFFSDYGNHVRIWEEAKAIRKLGHRLILVTYHNGDDMPGLDIRRSWDVPWIKRAVVGSSRHKLYLDVGLAWRAWRVALAEHPTLIHAHTHEAASIGVALKRMLKIPLILDYQGSMTSEMLDHRFIQRTSLFYPLLTRLERLINHQADAVVTSTYNAAQLLRRDGSTRLERIHTVIDSVNTERFRPFDHSQEWTTQRYELCAQLGIPPGRRIIVYIGLLAPYQGINALLDAAQILTAQRSDVHFLVMGHPDPTAYQSYAASLGIADHVTLPGRIIYKDLHSYLALGEVAVAPKMSLTEGNGKISNYMAMGLPVVTFDTPVSREILGDVGIYAQLGDVKDLAAKLTLALEDTALAARLGAAGRVRAIAEFSWEQAAQRFEAIYAQVLSTYQESAMTMKPSREMDLALTREHESAISEIPEAEILLERNSVWNGASGSSSTQRINHDIAQTARPHDQKIRRPAVAKSSWTDKPVNPISIQEDNHSPSPGKRSGKTES